MLTKNSFYEVMKLVYCGLIVVEQKYYKMLRFTLLKPGEQLQTPWAWNVRLFHLAQRLSGVLSSHLLSYVCKLFTFQSFSHKQLDTGIWNK
jgi:hypothetical protein